MPTMIDFEKVQKNIASINKTLSPKLLYHNAMHGEEVRLTALTLLERQKVTEEERLLVQTAALYHDAGFTVRYNDNEIIAVQIIKKELPKFGYTPKQIQTISGMILATQVPQRPKTKLQKLICDADLDNLGRPDFFKKTDLLWKEMRDFGIRITKKAWYQKTLKMLHSHQFFTQASIDLRQAGKDRNLRLLKVKIKSLASLSK